MRWHIEPTENGNGAYWLVSADGTHSIPFNYSRGSGDYAPGVASRWGDVDEIEAFINDRYVYDKD